MRQEAGRLADIRNDRMGELKDLERKYKWLCLKLGMDPCHIPSSGVPSTSQLKMLEERIKILEKLKEERFEQFINLKQSIILMYEQLEVEPLTGLEREIACEEADNFILSTSKLASASSVLTELEDRRFLNQKMVLEAADKIDRLYKLLQMDANDKCHFLSINRGYKTSIINKLHKEIDRLEGMKMENIGKIVNVKRKERNLSLLIALSLLTSCWSCTRLSWEDFKLTLRNTRICWAWCGSGTGSGSKQWTWRGGWEIHPDSCLGETLCSRKSSRGTKSTRCYLGWNGKLGSVLRGGRRSKVDSS